jgi:PAS domain-containing protein
MTMLDWAREFPGAITVCDLDGVILEMNERAAQTFAASGGRGLVGSNLRACHPEPARTRLEGLLATGERHVYTIEKRGVRKLIYQSPWFEAGQRRGLVELSLEIPDAMPHHVRAG